MSAGWTLGIGLPLATLVCAAAPQGAKAPNKAPLPAHRADFARDVAPLLKQYCASCHSGASPPGGIDFTKFTDEQSAAAAADVWKRVADNVRSGAMPPVGAPHPSDAQRAAITGWVAAAFAPQDCRIQDPGRVTMRRLNRDEYNNTIRDLIGQDLHLADSFPNDDVGYGFDNIGDVLSLSPLLLEKYLSAAEKAARAAILAPEDALQPIAYKGDKFVTTNSAQAYGEGKVLLNEGDAYVEHNFPYGGRYTIQIEAFGQQAGPDPARMAFKLDGAALDTVDVKAVEAKPEVYTLNATIPAGVHKIGGAFLNDYYNPDAKDPGQRDRNLVINTISIAPGDSHHLVQPASARRILIVTPTPATKDVAARKILANFARRAFRRPATETEIARLMHFYRLAQHDGSSWERSLQVGIEATLVSPDFLFMIERDPKTGPRTHLLNDYELATRLSYFLWSSMPDDTLLRLAGENRLHDPQVLAVQVKRMLKDPKAQALSDDFAAQWLTLRKLAAINPDRRLFPDWNNDLRNAMRTETLMFFQNMVNEDHSVVDLLDAKYTYVNEQLAKHYGLDGIKGPEFRRVELTDGVRGGILTQASILTVTSNPTRTSPVKRGKWVLETLFDAPPPPPPPNVGNLPDDRKGPLVGTLRQRMEEHRKNPICASCHAKMDPIGFGLENFNATGGWRTMDGGQPIDPSGVLPDGKKFDGPAGLRTVLLSRKTEFVRCMADKLMTYGLGRGLEATDKCAIDGVVARAAKDNYRVSSLVTAIVESDPFRKRRGSGGAS